MTHFIPEEMKVQEGEITRLRQSSQLVANPSLSQLVLPPFIASGGLLEGSQIKSVIAHKA